MLPAYATGGRDAFKEIAGLVRRRILRAESLLCESILPHLSGSSGGAAISPLKCYVLIELKVGKLTHQDLGQLRSGTRTGHPLAREP